MKDDPIRKFFHKLRGKGAEEQEDLVLVNVEHGGPVLHPRGRFWGQVVAVSNQEVSPFGLWCRITFRTSTGRVDKVTSPHYGEGTDIGLLLRATGLVGEGERLPKNWRWPGDLVGRSCEIVVVWSREHGALCARAVLPGEWGSEEFVDGDARVRQGKEVIP